MKQGEEGRNEEMWGNGRDVGLEETEERTRKERKED